MSTSTRRTSAAATVSRDERVAKGPRTPQANIWSARQSASAPAHVLHREAGDEAGADRWLLRVAAARVLVGPGFVAGFPVEDVGRGARALPCRPDVRLRGPRALGDSLVTRYGRGSRSSAGGG